MIGSNFASDWWRELCKTDAISHITLDAQLKIALNPSVTISVKEVKELLLLVNDISRFINLTLSNPQSSIMIAYSNNFISRFKDCELTSFTFSPREMREQRKV